jgi:hypothetical protein
MESPIMSIDVVMGGDEEESDEQQPEAAVDPDEFFAKNAFRKVYQTNNFFLPQIRDLVDRGEVINIRPEYQRRLRWTTPQKSKRYSSTFQYLRSSFMKATLRVTK